jgi:hypothetical protein
MCCIKNVTHISNALIGIEQLHYVYFFFKQLDHFVKLSSTYFRYLGYVITRVRRKIVGAPHQSATASHRYLFAASVNRGLFYNRSALHWIVMVGGILDALTIFRLSLVITYMH